MDTTSLLTLAGALMVMGLVPGPGVFSIIARALSQGFGAAVVQIAGIISGDMIWLTGALWGMTYLAAQYADWFVVVRVIGGLYLVWLGVKIWRSRPVFPGPGGTGEPSASKARSEEGLTALYFSGLLTCLGNPKPMLFYAAFFPTFVDLPSLDGRGLAIVMALSAGVVFCVLLGYAGLAARARLILSSPKAARRLNKTAGGVMIASGIAVAAQR